MLSRKGVAADPIWFFAALGAFYRIFTAGRNERESTLIDAFRNRVASSVLKSLWRTGIF
jgi:hypothetical protein